MPVARLIREALDRTAYDAILLGEFLGERKLANLYKLIEQARSFDESGVFCLADFITQLSEFVVRQPKEPLAATQAETMDVVRLMSIHQVEGAAISRVFVPDLDRRLGSQPPPAVFSKELGPLVKDSEITSGFNFYLRAENEEDLAETVRLLYVAATRAADYLILSSGLENPENEKKDEKEKRRRSEIQGAVDGTARSAFRAFSGECKKNGGPVKVIKEKPEPRSHPGRSDDSPPIKDDRRKDPRVGGKRGRLVAAVFGPGRRRGKRPAADVVLPPVGQAASTTCLPSPSGGHHEVVRAGGEGC